MSQLEVDKIIPQSGTTLTIGDSGDTITFGTGTAPQLGGDLSTNGNNINFGDNDRAYFGSGSDLEIYHDGSNSYIKETGTGNLGIQSNGTEIQLSKTPFEHMIRAIPDGAVKLYHNNSEKLETTSTGATVTGTLTTTDFVSATNGLKIVGNSGTPSAGAFLHRPSANTLALGTASTERMRIDSSGDVGIGVSPAFTAGGSRKLLQIANSTNGAQIAMSNSSNESENPRIFSSSVNLGFATAATGGGVFQFYTAGSERMRIDSSGNVGIGTSSPSEKLDVTGDVNILGSNSNKALTLNVSASGGTVLKLNTYQDNTDNRNWSFRNRYDGFGLFQLNRSTTQTGDSTTQVLTFTKDGNATFAGSVSKASGSFKIDHPLENKKDTHNLVHSFVESPQANNLYRGKLNLINGTATVNLDTVSGMTEGTFILLNRDIHCFTSNESGWTAVKGSVSGNILTITAQDNNCNDTISWLVIGERQDKHMYNTDWTDENGKVIVEPLKQSWEKLNSENNQPQ